LLNTESLAPGAEGWLQLELRDPLPLMQGDRFILRYPSPGQTIGGGEVIDPSIGRRLRRNDPATIARLDALSRGNPAELVVQAAESRGTPVTLAQLVEATALDMPTINTVLQSVGDRVLALGDGRWIGQNALAHLLDRLVRALEGYHRAEPLRPGMRLDRLRSQLNLNAAELEALLDGATQRGIVIRPRLDFVARPDHGFQPSRAQRAAIDRLTAAFANAPYTPPSYKEAAAIVGEDVLTALIEWGELVRVSQDVLLSLQVFREFASETERIIASEGRITIKALRDRFNTSRKYAQAVLEYFDSLGITRRDGDDHLPASGNWKGLE
jgi:selenocysteine-specific elongation factor